MSTNFKPCYVWPNEAIPFRPYYCDEKVRIFIIENLAHNFEIFKNSKNLRVTDYFFVIIGCYMHEQLALEAAEMFAELKLNKDNFFIMYNDSRERDLFERYNFKGGIINHNAWLDYNLVMSPLDCEKKYDAIYVARLIELKRHYLAATVRRLALVAGPEFGADKAKTIPEYVYLNDAPLAPNEVCKLINESYCGLILSELEGASFVSSEYLLCGVPVVSTRSMGGRDIWYDDYNSLVVDSDVKSINDAVQYFKDNPRDPWLIRSKHIEQSNLHRKYFIDAFASFLKKHDVDYVDAEKYFNANYFHKMRSANVAYKFYL